MGSLMPVETTRVHFLPNKIRHSMSIYDKRGLRPAMHCGQNDWLLMEEHLSRSRKDSGNAIGGRSRLHTVALALLVVVGTQLRAATFTASLDRDTISLGESATLLLAAEGGNPSTSPAPPPIQNLQISGSGTSSQFSFENGQSTSTITYTFTIVPSQVGDYTIPAITVEIAGQKLSSQPLMLKVLKPNPPAADAASQGARLTFVKLVLPKKDVYVGETITAQLQVYLHSRVGVNNFQLTAFPADGFTTGKMIQGKQHQTQIGNTVYVVIPIDVALKAVKAGPLTVGPVTLTMVLELPSPNRQRDPFDPFGLFGNRGEQKQVSLATDPENLQSLPLPHENVPPSFTGAIGTYTMTLTAGPTNVAAGDPITVRIQISGRGSLDALTLAQQPAWQDFKTYPPTTKVETTDALGLQGTKTFEQIVTPQNSDVKALPPFSFSFFDPDQKSYRTLTQPTIPLVVRPGGSTSTPTVVAGTRSTNESSPVADILPNKQRFGTIAQIGPPLAVQPWFLALQGVPVIAFVCALVWRRRTDKLANNPRLRRQRQVAQIIRDGLQELHRLAKENKSDEFFATLFRLLQEQLGERLDSSASSITESVVEERLRPRAVQESTLNSLQELFQTCNLARYAPIKTSQELAAVISKFESVIREVQRLKL